jgi:hypothetical protein
MSATMEKVQVSEVRKGDRISKTKSGEPMTVKVAAPSKSKATLNVVFEDGSTFGPRMKSTVWRESSNGSAKAQAEAEAAVAASVESQESGPGRRVELLQKAGMSVNSELTDEQSQRLDTLAKLGRKLPASLTGGKLADAIQKGKGMPGGSGGSGSRRSSKFSDADRALHERAVKLNGGTKDEGGPAYSLTIRQVIAVHKRVAKGDVPDMSTAALKRIAKGEKLDAEKVKPLREWIAADKAMRADKTMYGRKAAAAIVAAQEVAA